MRKKFLAILIALMMMLTMVTPAIALGTLPDDPHASCESDCVTEETNPPEENKDPGDDEEEEVVVVIITDPPEEDEKEPGDDEEATETDTEDNDGYAVILEHNQQVIVNSLELTLPMMANEDWPYQSPPSIQVVDFQSMTGPNVRIWILVSYSGATPFLMSLAVSNQSSGGTLTFSPDTPSDTEQPSGHISTPYDLSGRTYTILISFTNTGNAGLGEANDTFVLNRVVGPDGTVLHCDGTNCDELCTECPECEACDKLCATCPECEACVEFCNKCSECDECVEFCATCPECEACVEFCNKCSECDECVEFCATCPECEACVEFCTLCPECAACEQLCVKCGDCDECDTVCTCAPSITTTSLPNGTVGTAYNQTLSATSELDVTWTVGGSLPAGLTLSAAGAITGTPTASGTFTFTVTATNDAGADSMSFTVIIAAAAPPEDTGSGDDGYGEWSPSGGAPGGGETIIGDEDVPLAEVIDYAYELFKLGLFQGTGTNPDGSPIFDLESPLNRIQALILTIRLLGLEAEAFDFDGGHPFVDLLEWHVPYVAYAYHIGITKGISDTSFGPGQAVTSQQFTTFLLRALGYDEDAGDFTFAAAHAKALEIGLYTDILLSDLSSGTFLRADSVVAMVQALLTFIRGSDETMLLDTLVTVGFVAQEDADAFKRAIALFEERGF